MRTLLLIIGSTAVTLLVLEIALRMVLSPEKLYSNLPGDAQHNQRRNELQFFDKYASDSDRAFAGFDARLGWDTPGRVRGGLPDAAPGPGVTRMVTVGDSFVFGNEVEREENFSAVLAAASPRLEVLNMGVPGYGIDQAYLKYRAFGAPLRPAVVVFGIFAPDYERSSMTFTAFSKPQFRQLGTAMELINQPVPHPEDELVRIGESLQGSVYLFGLVRNAWRKLSGADRQLFFSQMDPVVAHILGSLQHGLDSDQRLIVLHIPRGESFVETDEFEDSMHQRLLTIYASLNLTVIDLRTDFLQDLPAAEIVRQYYVNRPGGAIGHLSAAGHRRVAALIAEQLKAH